MAASLDDLRVWLDAHEDEHLEFKEGKQNYHFEKLVKYCAALANEGGGRMILGVADPRPRRVVGSQAFTNLERTKAGLVERLRLRVEADALEHPDGRVVVFSVPSRPIGFPIAYQGAYWMRAGEDLVPMTPDQLKRIFGEGGPDFSAELCRGATLADLAPAAIQRFREKWVRKSRNRALAEMSDEQLLSDAELLVDGVATYAALVLFGTRRALGRHLAQAEVIFEYRSSAASIAWSHRKDYREGFFLFDDDLWNGINVHNDVQAFRDGLFVWDIRTFNEDAVREVILNAVSHRDYRLAGSVFVRQYPRELEVVSPGGLPPGITTENIVWRQAPRNRRIAEALARCGLVERSGQGMDRMFEECIKESKATPEFTGTDDYQVSVTLRGEVQDPKFLRFLERVGRERLATFTTGDFLVLHAVHRGEAVEERLRQRIRYLAEQGVVEPVGSGRGSRYVLSRRFYGFLGKKGVYTRKKGLDRETNKELLLKHIRDNWREGSRLAELLQVLPALSQPQVRNLVRDLRDEGRAHCIGRTRAARWYPGPAER